MNNLTFSVNKVTGLSVRFLSVFFCLFVVCATAEAGGDFSGIYTVTVAPHAESTGSGKVYLNGDWNMTANNEVKASGTADEKSVELLPSSAQTSLQLSTDSKKTDNWAQEVWVNFMNVKLKAQANPGSKFAGWTYSSTNTTDNPISLADGSYKKAGTSDEKNKETNKNTTVFYPKFTIRTYYYKMPGADANEGGKVYISTTAGRPAEDSGDWQTSIAGGTTALSQTADDNGRYAKATVKIYCYAQSPGDDYEFVGWFAATGSVISTSLDYEYALETKSEKSNSPTTNTLHAVFRPKNNVTRITKDNVETIELYTGTELFVEGDATYGKFPYHKKTRLDLRATFAPDGTPLFNTLYIFGLTTSHTSKTVSGQTGHKITPASTSAGSDAATPCYIYTNNGTGYDLTQTIINMNVANKQIADITTATSVYLTGYCPYATTGGGNNQDENGVICFTGGAGVNTHVYVDDLQLFARYKSNNGNTSKPDTIKPSFGLIMRVTGSSSAFIFKGTSSNNNSPFLPTIHMRDSNRLAGNTGSAIYVDVWGLASQTAGQYNSPIGLMTDADERYTTLSIDDIWPASMADSASGDVRTNGFLDIRTTTAAPCIDLYDEYGKVNFNGGRIYMKNSRPSGSNNYLCTFAVGFRKYEKSIASITATMYGLGTDQSGGEVNFNDGSFYIDPLTDDEFTKHGKYYHHKYALKCPASSTINGGTYYCEPFSCMESENLGASPLNKYGDGLVLDTVAVVSLLKPYKTAVINFPNDKENTATIDATHPQYLGEYYALAGRMPYGISSLNAYQGTQAPDSVILMLPVQYTDKELQKEVANVPWALCAPYVAAGSGEYSVEMGGNIEVADKEENNVIYQTNSLLYGAVDEYIMGLIEGGYSSPEFDGMPQAEITLQGGTYSDIINAEPYTIQQEQYMLMSVKADEWFLFAPPFDISAVYVLETAVETELETMAKNEGWQAAINKQAAANMDLFYALCYTIGYKKSVNNFDGVFYSWKTDLKPAGAGGQVKLTHFTGSNWDTANYYVQRSSGTWGWDSEKSRFVTDWEYLPDTMEKVTHGETEYSVVMKKGEIYSLNFPYMYNGYREKNGEGNFNWDYWTGKYILFVGKGPQTIEGKNYHDTIIEPIKVSSGYAEIRANSTFASMEVSNMGAYYLGEGQQFRPLPFDDELQPIDATQGFVLLNEQTASPMPQRIKTVDMMSGEVTYEEGGDGTATGTPTIAGDNKMLVYTTPGAVGIVPVVAQQVRIYNAAGQLVAAPYLTDETQIPLPSGIYLVTGEQEQFKVMVK